MPNLIGTGTNQVPTNGDLGSMSHQDALSVSIGGGSIALKHNNSQGFYQDTYHSDIRPSLLIDFVNSKQFDSRIHFDRVSQATYYDGKTFAKGDENLLTYSNRINMSPWALYYTDVATNTLAAPDGTMTANCLLESSNTNLHYVQQRVKLDQSLTYTYSGYFKYIDRQYVAMSVFSGADAYQFVSVLFSLSDGKIVDSREGNSEFNAGYNQILSKSITSVGNGWYRCSITFIPGGIFTANNASQYVGIWLQNDLKIAANSYGGSGVSYAGSGKQVGVWGLQLEQRSSASGYVDTLDSPITTTFLALKTANYNEPRLDFDPITYECKGLLIEESRTNLISYSSPNSYWTSTSSNLSTNATIAPDGTLTASKINETTAANYRYSISPTYNVTAGITYTKSVYLKAAGNNSNISIGAASDGNWTGGSPYINFNLNTGTMTVTGSNVTGSMTPVGNGWYRCTMTATCSTSSSDALYLIWTTAKVSGTGFTGAYVWGAQTEVGKNATSVILTNGAQTTRAADISIMKDNFSWYNPAKGSFIIDSQMPVDAAISGNSYRHLIYLTTQSAGDYIGLCYNNINNFEFSIRSNNIVQQTMYFGTNTGKVNRVAVAYEKNNFNLTYSGLSITKSSGFVSPYIDRMYIGCVSDGNSLGQTDGYIRRIVYYPVRLSDAELQEISL